MWQRVITFSVPLKNVTCDAACAKNPEEQSGPGPPTVADVPATPSPPDVAGAGGDDDLAGQAPSVAEQLLEDLLAQLTELEQRRKHTLSELQQFAVEIATAVAERFLHREIQAGKHDIEKLVSAALACFEADAALTIELHPGDLQQLQQAGKKKFDLLNHGRRIRFRSNATLARGNCRVDADHYGIIFDWEAQLVEIRAALLRTLDDAEVERRQTRPDDRQLGRFPDRRETA